MSPDIRPICHVLVKGCTTTITTTTTTTNTLTTTTTTTTTTNTLTTTTTTNTLTTTTTATTHQFTKAFPLSDVSCLLVGEMEMVDDDGG